MSLKRLDEHRNGKSSGWRRLTHLLSQPLSLGLLSALAILIVALAVQISSSPGPLPGASPAPISSPLGTNAPTNPPPVTLTPPATEEPANSTPVLAYYYIWFDVQSWDRAKTDYPLLGRYSSDDAAVMRQHIQWAQEAGIDGFIVSWKGRDKLNRRLDQLVQIAGEEDFKLAIIYESLDFERNPLPVEQVSADLNYFVERYAEHPVFDLFEKPMVIWAGTWEFSLEEIQSVVQDKRERIFILASEKNVKDYQRVAQLVDGDAYYWSSVNPDTHRGYAEKLIAMGEAVHENGGLWVAPAAPGYDSRLLGGTTVIDRKEGETLRTEMETALGSAPDVIGLISWNEFSENSHIEPSENHGDRYLEVLAETRRITPSPK
jgi:hypothetical protein